RWRVVGPVVRAGPRGRLASHAQAAPIPGGARRSRTAPAVRGLGIDARGIKRRGDGGEIGKITPIDPGLPAGRPGWHHRGAGRGLWVIQEVRDGDWVSREAGEEERVDTERRTRPQTDA